MQIKTIFYLIKAIIRFSINNRFAHRRQEKTDEVCLKYVLGKTQDNRDHNTTKERNNVTRQEKMNMYWSAYPMVYLKYN